MNQDLIEQSHSIYPPDFSWTGHIVQAQLPGTKKGKVVRSAHCEVCKVDCNGPSVFEQHILAPLIGPQENPCTSKARKRGADSTTEDLESKRRRVVECGVSNESIRLCRICNVVCNSDIVYNDHLAGQKHAAKAAKALVNYIDS